VSRDVPTTVAVVALGYWGPNLARNFDALAKLKEIVASGDESRRASVAGIGA
jgi:hypothetical protein